MNTSKGHYLDCIELLEKNSRNCSYMKAQAEELRNLVEEFDRLRIEHQKLERAYFGQETTIKNLKETLYRLGYYGKREFK